MDNNNGLCTMHSTMKAMQAIRYRASESVRPKATVTGITLREYVAEVQARNERQLKADQDMARQALVQQQGQTEAFRQRVYNYGRMPAYVGATTTHTTACAGTTLASLMMLGNATQQQPYQIEEAMTRLERFKAEQANLERAQLKCAPEFEQPIQCQLNALSRLIRQLESGVLVRDLVYTDPQRVTTSSYNYRVAALNTWAAARTADNPPSEYWSSREGRPRPTPYDLVRGEDYNEPQSLIEYWIGTVLNKITQVWLNLKPLIFVDKTKENHADTGRLPEGTEAAAAGTAEAKA